MGAQLSSWQYPEPKEYAAFLVKLFGNPDYGVRSAGGALIWTKGLATRKLFAQGMAFNKVMIKDERIYQSLPKPCYTYLYLFVSIPPLAVQDALACQIHNIYTGAVYDFQTGNLWVRVDNLERGIAVLRIITDFLYGAVTMANLQAGNAVLNVFGNLYDSSGKAKPATIATHYAKLISNLGLLAQVAGQVKGAAAVAATPQPVDVSLEHGMPNLTDFETLQKLETTDSYKATDDSLMSSERFENPYGGYTSNNPLTLSSEQGWDDKFYAVPRPYLGSANPGMQAAYASQDAGAYSIENLKIHPSCKGACASRALSQFEKDKKREQLRSRPNGSYGGRATYNMLAVPAAAGVSAVADANRGIERLNVKPSGSYAGRATYNMLAVPAASGVSKFTERMSADPLSGNVGQRTDPRFLVGSANQYYNVGSDVMDITRLYGTVEQNQRFPLYTDTVKYGITSVPTIPTNPLEQRRMVKPPVSSDFRTPGAGTERMVRLPSCRACTGGKKEHMVRMPGCRACTAPSRPEQARPNTGKKEERFVSTGSEHVKVALATEAEGVDPFLYWTEGK